MKKNILVKKFLGADSIEQNSLTKVMVRTLKTTMSNSVVTNSITETKIQPIDEFRFSERCYCGIH